MLVDAAMRGIALEGACYATLGLAPLKGVESAPAPAWARWAFTLSHRYLDPLYSFQGLAAFKAKFRPDGWENVYLTGVPGVTPRMLLSVLAAFARSHPVRFAGITLRRIVRRGLHAIQPERWRSLAYAFAALLLVWIVLLRLADSDYWFGAGPARDIWIAFDLMMTGVFIAIGRGAGARSRFVLPLAFTALGAVLTDLFLTATQAFAFHLQRRASPIETLLWLVALSGPALATTFLLGLGIAAARWRARQINIPDATAE
jgi:hypothetical protein